MALTNREMFAQALNEALSREYREELAECDETAECSFSHYKKMSKILGYDVVPKSMRILYKKKLIIAILAATLLLAGCTAVIFRNEIKSLFENVFDSFVVATYDEERYVEGEIIEEYYIPTYIPNGYVLDNETITLIQAVYKYKDGSGNFLKFEQTLIDSAEYVYDNNDKTIIEEINGQKIYFRISGEYYNYVWNNEIYTFKITSKYKISKEEIEAIVKGLLPQ